LPERRGSSGAAERRGTAEIPRKVRKLPKPDRRLRVYALDPSIGKRYRTIAVNETTLSVKWETLQPGPVGEYLEVVDIDPASDRVYEPVDLNDPELLAQDGWPPSEGNPKFHQQMVYAVGMTTINNFEKALGRKALWAPKKSGEMVPRLRIYPHALRTENAYYSPEKKALLFGYFPANSDQGDATASGSMVFACLSSDIVAHEMTHALLDGLHRRFEEASNPDVPAFHEGFADIVALFQHFTIPELVSFEIANVRGDLTQKSLLSGLAEQFGEGSGNRGPLRDYLNADPKVLHYPDVPESHTRGSILVYAVYDAFRMIVDRRTQDLRRIATGGTGVLPDGAIHPDLVARLTDETCRAARHVVRMCIRALDYCPPVDITFGDYLRAIITADLDAVEDDRFGYRVAFMEAFRKWNILPFDVRTVSETTLAWNTPETPERQPPWLSGIVDTRGDAERKRDGEDADDRIVILWNKEPTRADVFELSEQNRWRLWRRLHKAFRNNPALYRELGLERGLPRYNNDGTPMKRENAPPTTFEVHNVRLARRISPDGGFKANLVVVIAQRKPIPFDGKDVQNGFFWFRGGATLIIDPTVGQEKILYSIIKNTTSKSRCQQQTDFVTKGSAGSLRALYFGNKGPNGDAEPFALMHADVGEVSDV